MGCGRLALHHRVVLESNLIVPVANQVLEQCGGARDVEEGGKDRALGEALAEEHAGAVRADRDDVELLGEA